MKIDIRDQDFATTTHLYFIVQNDPWLSQRAEFVTHSSDSNLYRFAIYLILHAGRGKHVTIVAKTPTGV